jgi:uncharacterized Zn-finger protein
VVLKCESKTVTNVSHKIISNSDGAYLMTKMFNTESRRFNTEYVCLECDKTFMKNSNVICHVRVHSGNKPFFCKWCHEGFKQAGQLAKHYTTDKHLQMVHK